VASVVVVGGGLAGLACAWRLGRAGHDVEVLERQAEPGGSARSEERLGFRLERGPQLALRGDANLRAVLAALGLEASLVAVEEPALGILRDGRIHACDARSPARLLASVPLDAGARLRCLRLGVDLVRLRHLLDPARPERAAPLDGPDAGARLRRRAGEAAWSWLVAPALAAATGTAPAALSEAAALLCLRRAATGLAPGRLAGGTARLAAELARHVRVRTGREVVRVETETDGARVRYRSGGREHSVLAGAAVVALPGASVTALCPKLTPAERGFFESLVHVPQVAVRLLLDRPPAAIPPLVLVPDFEGLGLAALRSETAAAPAGAGLLTAALDEAAARALGEAPDADVVACVLRALARTPLAGLEVAHAVVERRSSVRFGPGSLRRLAAFHARVDRSARLAFAGEYLLGPGLEAALTTGMRAATDLARSLPCGGGVRTAS
jgi:oxygen-dependent protoporphyrinogen oxidase